MSSYENKTLIHLSQALLSFPYQFTGKGGTDITQAELRDAILSAIYIELTRIKRDTDVRIANMRQPKGF